MTNSFILAATFHAVVPRMLYASAWTSSGDLDRPTSVPSSQGSKRACPVGDDNTWYYHLGSNVSPYHKTFTHVKTGRLSQRPLGNAGAETAERLSVTLQLCWQKGVLWAQLKPYVVVIMIRSLS